MGRKVMGYSKQQMQQVSHFNTNLKNDIEIVLLWLFNINKNSANNHVNNYKHVWGIDTFVIKLDPCINNTLKLDVS